MVVKERVFARELVIPRPPCKFALRAVGIQHSCMDTPKFPHHLDCEALTSITADHLPRDGSLGRVRRYPKGADLWQADDPADRIYFLRRGRVEIVTATPDERPVVLRTIEAGQPFGELCVCTARARTRETTAHALVASEAIEIKLNSFLGYLRQNREALEALVCTLCLRLTDTEHRVEVLAHRGAEQRLGRLMIRLGTLGTRSGRGTPRDTVTLSLSHNELARMAGMTRPHVTVTLGRLRRRGLVRYQREGPLRVDVPGLTAYLGRLTREAG